MTDAQILTVVLIIFWSLIGIIEYLKYRLETSS